MTKQQKRVIVEYFEMLYPVLNRNADLMIGIGEEVIVTRPSLFGPLPQNIADIVYKSLIYRKMAHSAEDLYGYVSATWSVRIMFVPIFVMVLCWIT